ncbi:MAG: Na+/H+ antiporter NhaC family protein, partial [Anaerovorax sp.]
YALQLTAVQKKGEVMELGILTLIPPIFIIIFAITTKKTFEALVLGGLIGCVIGFKGDFFNTYLGFLYDTMCDADVAWIILVIGLFGCLIGLMKKANATVAFSEFIYKRANSEKKASLAAWVLGIIIFMDDYLNILTVGTAFKDVGDKLKSPREMLAYIIDSTGTPVCMLIPISTQAVYWAGMLAKEQDLAFLGSGMEIFIKTIPFSFYAWAAVIIVPLVILGVIPKIGPMKKAYERVATTGMVYSPGSKKFNTDDLFGIDKKEVTNGSVWDFFLPMIVLIGGTIYFDMELLIGVVLGLITATIMYGFKKRLNFEEWSESFLSGFFSMGLMFFIIVTALTLRTVLGEIGMADYIIATVAPHMIPAILPAIAFVIVAILAFVTGSCWGVPAVTLPILIPLATTVGADPLLTAAAILSSATFGSHACFYSDATVLTSSAVNIENMDHCLTQIPYALIAAGIAMIGYLIMGFVM